MAMPLHPSLEGSSGMEQGSYRCHSGEIGDKEARKGWRVVRAVASAGLLCVLSASVILSSKRDGIRPGRHTGYGDGGVPGADMLEEGFIDSTFGMAASSSLWDGSREDFDGLSSGDVLPLGSRLTRRGGGARRRLLNGEERLRSGMGGGKLSPPMPRKPREQKKPPATLRGSEPAMLNDFGKPPVDYLDLDNVQEGYLWIPVSLERFDPMTTDPLVKMCQVAYSEYSAAPWILPMGGLLSLHSGCADVQLNTVQLIRLSALERILANSSVPVDKPTGFIFHETRCGSTLVANMLASVQTNVMWSESTGPWKVMHTCPKCPKAQIVRFLKVVMDAMTRSPNHNRFYFKFQSSEDIDAVTSAYPDVPWVFIFREPVEVMMSRLGAQRIGMEGMEKEVTARIQKGMAQQPLKLRLKGKPQKESQTAMQLAGLCKKAISAFEDKPETGMVVEYTHLPDGLVTTVLPRHFNVHVSPEEREIMMTTTRMYSKVATFSKNKSHESKFTEDIDTKHNAASAAVTEAAQKFLYDDYNKLRSMQTWYNE